MKPSLKVLVLLFCICEGEGLWLRSLIGHKQKPLSSPDEDGKGGNFIAEDIQVEGSGAESSPVPLPTARIPVRTRRSTPDSQCGLRSILLQVRDLGLGYDSDETVLFKYCGGTCPRARSNYDLTISSLLLGGLLPHPTPGEQWHSAPCCRPTHYEDMAFLDNAHRWHKVEKLSAAACSCVD